MVNADTIRAELRAQPYCLLEADVGSLTSWARGRGSGTGEDILVGSDGTPAVLCSAFTIETQGFYLGPDGGFDPGRIPEWLAKYGPVGAYALGKASALLGPVPSMREDFETTMSTLQTICESTPNMKGERMGAFVHDGGQAKVRVGHSHFQLRSGVAESQIPLLPVGDDNTLELADGDKLDLDVLPPFRIANWPCAPNCKPFRDAIVATHKAQPLPAFMRGSTKPILPTDYIRLLRGAVAQVNFTLSHKVLRRKVPVSYFTITIDEIIVLQEHVPADLSPSRARLASRFLIPQAPEPAESEPTVKVGNSNKRRRA